MVKMPSLDDLKKAGAGFVDSAKSGHFTEMVDKLKSGIESVGVQMHADELPLGDNAVKTQCQVLRVSLTELMQLQQSQAALIRNLESQLVTLEKMIETGQLSKTTATSEIPAPTKKEDKK